jgi:hypothetical protein
MERSAIDAVRRRAAIPGSRDVATTMPMSFAVSARDHVLSVQGAIGARSATRVDPQVVLCHE